MQYSIVVPTYNRPHRIAECLRAISEVAYPTDRFEAVIVDDGGTEPIDRLAELARQRFQCRLITQANAGPAAARNAGVRAAQGRYIVFTDDDCRPAPNVLTTLDSILAGTPGAAIGGHTLNALRDNIFAEASQDMVDFLIRRHEETGTASRFFTTSNLTLSREVFDRAGGFSATFPLAAAEDREFCERLAGHGVPLVYAPNVIVYHAHDLTLTSFWRQHFRYGRGRRELERARTARGRPTRLEGVGFYVDLVTDPLRRRPGWHGAKLTMLNALSQAAYATGYVRERLTR